MVNEIDFSIVFERIICIKNNIYLGQGYEIHFLVAPHWDWLTQPAKIESTLTKEFKNQVWPELSRKCTSVINWYGASGWCSPYAFVLCFLLCILQWNHWQCPLVPYSENMDSASGPTYGTSAADVCVTVVFENFVLLSQCKVEADALFLSQ